MARRLINVIWNDKREKKRVPDRVDVAFRPTQSTLGCNNLGVEKKVLKDPEMREKYDLYCSLHCESSVSWQEFTTFVVIPPDVKVVDRSPPARKDTQKRAVFSFIIPRVGKK